jgi:SNF2 family DNA or RNA helicase
MPRVNLLIADDVGLGKTIEAGLVVQEMILRHRVRTVLIVCPSSLQVQWKEEMRDKFGLEFRIIDSEAISNLRRKRGIHVNPWSHFPRLITSIDFLKRERPLRTFRETLPAGDQPTYPRAYLGWCPLNRQKSREGGTPCSHSERPRDSRQRAR